MSPAGRGRQEAAGAQLRAGSSDGCVPSPALPFGPGTPATRYITKAMTRDIWSCVFQHTFSKSYLIHSFARSNALEGSRLGDVSINTSSLAALLPLSLRAEGYGVSLSCCGNLGCRLRSCWSVKAQSFVLPQLSSQCSPPQKASQSAAFHVVCALRR